MPRSREHRRESRRIESPDYDSDEGEIMDYLRSLPDDIRLMEDPTGKRKVKCRVLHEERGTTKFPNAILMEESAIEEPVVAPVKTKKKSMMEMMDDIIEDQTGTQNVINDDRCRNCGAIDSAVEDTRTGSIGCTACGAILEALPDQGPEWRSYSNEDSRGTTNGRCGGPTNPFYSRSTQGSIIVGIGNGRIKKRQEWSNNVTYPERSFRAVSEIIMTTCAKARIRKAIAEYACILWKIFSECKKTGSKIIVRGDSRRGVLAGLVYKSCEINEHPRTIREIAKCFGLEEKQVTKGIRRYDNAMLNSEVKPESSVGKKTDIAEDFIRRHCPHLRIGISNTNLAVKIANNCSKLKLACDHNPESIAAGAILTMVRYKVENVSIDAIANLIGPSSNTINKIHQKLLPFVEALVRDDLTDYLVEKYNINGEYGELKPPKRPARVEE